jgi:hypothetical protein
MSLEKVLFRKNKEKIKIKLYINELLLQVSEEFKYKRVIFAKNLTGKSISSIT